MLLATLFLFQQTPTQPVSKLSDELRRLAQPLIAAEIVPGLVVGWISSTGDSESFGLGRYSNKDERVPDGRTIFEIGSITKTFTALAFAAEVERSSITLETTLNELVPSHCQLPRSEKPVRLIDLATHTAGFPSIPSNLARDATRFLIDYSDFGEAQLHSFMRSFSSLSDPGERYLYSNAGYGILGWALAHHSNQSVEQMLIKSVCHPLQMLNTRFRIPTAGQIHAAPGHDSNGDVVPRTEYGSLDACGELTSTADDLARYLAVLLAPSRTQNEPLRRALTNATRVHFKSNAKYDLGLAWHFPVAGSAFFHDGRTDGHSAFIFVDREHQTAGIVLANGSTERIGEFGVLFQQLLNGEQIDPPKLRVPLQLSSAQLSILTGHYRSPLGFELSVTLENGRLYTEQIRQPAVRLLAAAPNRFYAIDQLTEFSFELGEQDQSPSSLTVRKNGRQTRYSRR
ncbi:MAG: D-alanyl-D-alanine-carboxypeptidase/D-alanyl-D-alanine-endopeptidase [Planctomycetota bacterium]|jgi:D-alanyl-D-alanine-carboxypeptidase/D-alanyl-D-alanine-endopeptidase